jgi:hypothetical protein
VLESKWTGGEEKGRLVSRRNVIRTRKTRRAGPGLGLLLALLGACASPGGPVPQPGPAPGPVGGPAGSAGLPRFGLGGPRSLRYTDAIRQISLKGGHLGWGGLQVGMTYHEAELVVGRELPPLGSSPPDMLCGYSSVEAEALRQPLRLEFGSRREEGRLKAIWLPLAGPEGEPPGRQEIVSALKARFPQLEYVPSPHDPEAAESVNPRPLYRLGKSGMMFFVDPRRGLYFGEICID